MARRKGSLNKPKPAEDLIKQLEAQGYKFSDGVGYPPQNQPETPPDLPPGAAAIDAATGGQVKKTLNINVKPQVYRCGNCREQLPGELTICPYCQAALSW